MALFGIFYFKALSTSIDLPTFRGFIENAISKHKMPNNDLIHMAEILAL